MLLYRSGKELKTINKNKMKEIELNKDGYLQEVKEWEAEDLTDFLMDFASVKDEDTIHEKAKEIFQNYINKGYKEWEAEFIADGYEQALLDIYNQIK